MLFFYKSPNGLNKQLSSSLIHVYRKTRIFAAFLTMLGFLSQPLMAQNPLSSATGFNLFTEGNVRVATNESEGPMAIGGNLTIAGTYQISSVNAGLTISGVPISLVVKGGLVFTSGKLTINNDKYIKIGNCGSPTNLKVWYVDNNNAASNIRITEASQPYPNPQPAFIEINKQAPNFPGGVSAVNNPVCENVSLDMAVAFTTLRANSLNLTNCTDNIKTTNANGDVITNLQGANLYLADDNPNATGPRIWNVSGSDLNAVNEIITNFTFSASRPLIINVNAPGDFEWDIKNQNFSGGLKYVIWNFYNATKLTLKTGDSVDGSILAPNADVFKETSSNVDGQVIAKTFDQNGGEIHDFPFEGNVPSCSNTVCMKPNAGNDTTVCVASIQLKAPAQDEIWAFLSSNNGNTPSITTGGLASGLSVSGQYKFVLKKQSDLTCSDTVTVTKANFILAKLSDQTICPGEILTFGYQGLSNVTYNWSTGATTPTITVSPVQTTDYTVTVTSTNTGCSAKDTVKVTVDPKPNAGADTVSCTATLKIKAAGQGETWSFSSFNDPNNVNITDVAIIDNQGNISSLDKNGFYRFILTNSNGCTDTIRVQKTSVTIPVISLNPVCPGTTLTFGYNNTQDFTYSWSTGALTAQITVKPDSTTDYYVTVTSKLTNCSAIDTVTVTVKPAPTLTLVSSICSPDNSKYITTVTVDAGTVVTSNAGVVSGSGTTFTVTTGSDTTQYTITATLAGCTTKLTVNKPDCTCPQISNPVAPGGSICGTGTTTLTATGCAAATTAKWYSNVGLTNEVDADSSFTTPALSQNTDYYAACVNTAKPICKSSGVKVTVTVKPLPTFRGVGTNCAAGNSIYTVTVSSTGTVTIKSPVAAQISGSGPYTITNVPAGQNLVLTSTLNGCSKDTTITAPNCGCTPETPSALAANVGICAGDPIPNPTFTAIVGANTTVDWYSAESGGTLLASNTLTFTATAAGTFYIQAKSTLQGCNDQVNSTRVPVTLTISPKPIFTVEAKDPMCQGATALNDGGVKIMTGTVGNSYAFNTTGFGTLPIVASGGTAIASFPVTIAQNIPNNTSTLTYYVRVFSNEGCYKDTTVSVRPKTCDPACPTITIADASDTLCSGYYGEPIVVTVSDTSKIVRFVYFTTQQTGSGMYTGGTLIEEVTPQGPIVGAPNGIPGLQLPANTSTTPVQYYVYAVLKTPPTSSPNCFPYAEKVYTVLPLPKFEMDSIPACTGDTTYMVNLSITPVGTFTVYVASGISSIGNGPIPTGISQTLTNIQGGGQLTALTLKTTGNYFIVIQDANGCATVGVAPKPSFKACDGVYDLALDKSISTKTAKVGDDITYTIKVWNEGQSTATNVSVKDTLNAGVQYVTYATATGNYNSASGIWTIGDLAPGDTAVLLVVVKVVAQGVWFNTAEICSMTEKDEDSTPCNGEDDEDDIDRECFSVPLELCTGEGVQVSVPQQYQDVKWFKDGGATAVATGNVLLITEPGTYTFTALSNTCPAQGCCPIIVEPGSNCCPADLCVPFIIKQTKKGGQLLK